MDRHDVERFGNLMAALAENFHDQLSAIGIELRFMALAEFSIEEVERAAMGLLRDQKFKKMPTVADFIEYLQGSGQSVSEAAAQKAIYAVRTHGHRKTIVFDDPVLMSVIHQLGGWVKFCEDCGNEDQVVWMRKHVALIYDSHRKLGRERFGSLPGLIEIDNRDKGDRYRAAIGPPVFVGDEEKARAVLEHIGEAKLIGGT